MAWLDTAASWANSLGNIYNAAKPLINTGAAIYDRNQTQGAISDAFNQYKGYADQSLNTLGQVYNQGVQATQPYRQAGTSALSGYQNLLQNPSQITNDPGYQFRLKQGEQAVTRNAAANRMLGSGNFAAALQDYGQGMASSELDRSLSRYLPMVQAGQNATGQQVQAGQNYGNAIAGINLGLGEAAAGSRIGQAGANTRLVTDFLGLTGGQTNPFGQAADAARGVKTLADGVNKLGTLLNGGSAASVSGLGTMGATTTGSALGSLGTSAGAGQVAGALPAGSQYSGMLGTMDALGGATPTIQGAGTAGTGTVGASGAGTAAAPSAAAVGAVYAVPFLMAAISKFGQGGSAESAKSGKFAQQLQRDAQADPSGRAAQQTVDRLLTGKLWPGEGNQWVISDLMKSGVVTMNTPSLYSKNSVVDVFAPADSVYKLDSNDLNSEANAKIWALSGGLQPAQADQFANLYRQYSLNKQNAEDPSNGSLTRTRANTQLSAVKSQMDKMIAQIEEGRKATARQTYNTLKGQGYTGDLSKLETYLGVR